MRDILLTTLLIGFVPVAVMRPYIGMVVFAWIGYMNPHRYSWGFAYEMPFAAIIGIATIVGFLFTRDKDKLPLNSLMIVWICWILWMNVTTFFALIPDQAANEWERAMKIQLMTVLAVSLMQDRQRLNLLVWVIALSVGFFGIKGGVFVALSGGNYLVWGPPDTFFEGNNGVALALMMVMPLFWYLRVHSTNVWIKRAMTVSMILIAISIAGSYSRGAVLGLVAISVYLLYKSRHKWALAPLVLMVAVGLVSFLPEKWFDRLSTIQTYEEDASAMGRINAWTFGYNLAVDRPAFGGGFGAYDPELFQRYAPEPDDFHDAHSIYFEVLGEHGFLGLALFLSLGWLALRHGNKIRSACKGKPELDWAYDLASMTQVGLVGYAVSGMFLGLAYFDLYYHLIVIMLVTRVLVKRELESQKDALSLDHRDTAE